MESWIAIVVSVSIGFIFASVMSKLLMGKFLPWGRF